MRVKKNLIGDAVIFSLCLFLVLISIFYALRKKSGRDVLLVFAGDEKYIYPLTRDGVYEIPGKIGVSVIRVEDGKARFLDSPCPNKTCVASHPVSKNGEWAACLPNDVFIRVESSSDDLDAVAF